MLRERFQSDFSVLRLHSDKGGDFSSDLLAAFCAEHGIRQTFTRPASPQQNGVAERRIGLVMEVARTSMIHAVPPHFLWPFVVRYAAHQLNLWPRVSLPETSSTLLWTGKVGDASRFRVWGARAFVRDTTAEKLSPRTIPCDVTFDESVPFYRLFPYRTAPRPLPPLFLAPGPSQVYPLPAPGPAPSGVSQVDPPVPAPVEVTGDSGPAGGGAVPGGAELGGAQRGGAESGGAEREGPAGTEPGGAKPAREVPGGPASGGTASGGAEPGGAESGGESPEGSETAVTRSPWSSRLCQRVPLTSQQLHDWYGRRLHRASAPQDSTAGGSSAGVTGAGGGAGLLPSGGASVAGPGGARTRGTGAAGAGGVVSDCTGAAEGAGAAGGDRAAGGSGAAGAGRPTQPRLFFAPPSPSSQPLPDSALCQVLSLPSSTGLPLQPGSLLPAPSPYTEQTGGLSERRESASRPVSPVRFGRSGSRVPRQRQPAVPGPHLVVRRPPSPQSRVPVPSPPASSLPVVADPASDQFRAEHSTVTRLLATVVSDPSFYLVAESDSVCPPSVGGECALGTDVLEDRQEDLECLAAAAPHLVAMLLAPEGDPDAPDIPTPRSYAEAIAALPFLQGSLHEEIWLRHPPDFTGSFPPGTQWSLRRPVYGLHQAPREWHDTLRTTLAALGFAPSTADPSLFLRTDTSLPPFYILVYVDDLVFATADTEALALVKSELQKRHTCTDPGHSLSAPPLDESVEPSGPYPELVGCLITSGMGLVLGGRGDVVLTGHSDASWVDDQATQRSSQGYTFSLGFGSISWRSTCSSSVFGSSCEAEIYATAMAEQELRWLTYLLTDLGEQPRSPPVLYVDNKAAIALC
ncbi:unnamed protein product [Closterium sp. NIES-54]